MSATLIENIIAILATYGPEAYAAVVAILQKKNPQPSDWDALSAIVSKDLHAA